MRLPYLLSLLITVASPLSAWATVSVNPTDDILVLQADAIVIGTISSIESIRSDDTPGVFTVLNLRVEEVLKGEIQESDLLIRHPGGILHDQRVVALGAPEFAESERVLLFLGSNDDGTFHVVNLAQGKFTLGIDATVGAVVASRAHAHIWPHASMSRKSDDSSRRYFGERMAAEDLKDRIRRLVRGEDDEMTGFGGRSSVSRGQFSSERAPSPSRRWVEPDRGEPILLFVDDEGEPSIPGGGGEQIDAAIEAWNSTAASGFRFETAPSRRLDHPTSHDGLNSVLFSDRLNVMSPPLNCTGTLALTLIRMTANATQIIDDRAYSRILEADVIFNDGWEGCGIFEDVDKFAEIATHELGHVAGLLHSRDQRATMFSLPRFDGRGTQLAADDVKSISSLYPAAPAGLEMPAPISLRVDPRDSSFPAGTVTFEWSANDVPVSEWWLWIGSAEGQGDLYNSGSLGPDLSDTVTGLPTDGGPVFVRVWFKHAETSQWSSSDFQYVASTRPLPRITMPLPRTPLPSPQARFEWDANGVSVSEWWLWIGASRGARDWYDSGSLGTDVSDVVSDLPEGESPVFVRLWYTVRGSALWQFQDFTYFTSRP